MSYDERHDGRNFDELRPMEAKVGIVPQADGSAMFRIGNTVAYAAVYGPKDLYPRFLKDPQKGVLRCHYNMMPFSGYGERVRPGGNRRSKEISLVSKHSLLPVLDLSNFANAAVDVFIEFPQTNAGSRCAGICAASMALADAGIEMKELVSAVSVGIVGDKVVVDLDYKEEAYEDGPVADVPIALTERSNKFSLLQMDGEIQPAQLQDALQQGQKALQQIFTLQRQALKQKYTGDSQ